MTSKSRGHCDNIKVFNQGNSNQIREKSGNLIAKNVWPPCILCHAKGRGEKKNSEIFFKLWVARLNDIFNLCFTSLSRIFH